MIALSFSQGISSAGWITALCLLVGAVAVWLWLYPAPTRPDPVLLSPAGPPDPKRSTQGDRLRQAKPNKNKTDTLEDAVKPEEDVDIIAIHGLDTQSPDTWIWDPKGDPVNWLEDPHMLPKRFPTARIFTCDWPAALFERPGFAQKMIEELARLLLAGIKARPPAMSDQPERDRPIVFVASCLGGIILAKALVMASCEYESVKRATRGIVFLATPFRGTSFQHVAAWAEPGLRLWASMQDKNVSNRLELVKSTFHLGELVRSFTALCQKHELTGHVFNFYETGNSLGPRLPVSRTTVEANAPQLVDSASATLDIVPHPRALDRAHVTMNKFSGPHDPGYVSVTGVLDILLCDIHNGRPIENADRWIRSRCYSMKELQIERLSGVLLPINQCYINLAILERPDDKTSHSAEAVGAQKASPFSLHARLKVKTPKKAIQVTLPTLFEPRKARDGTEKRPRRILIRGQAGVGKTTLCKKIVYEFTHAE
ncbi:hypothetical protein V8F06_014791 [Rhypophila decipiens]